MTEGRQPILTPDTLDTPFAEAYRALRANINFSSIDQPVKVVVVTSAGISEGKTTTVANLGIIMAQAGAKTLVVDADFRRPSLHHVFGLSQNGSGPMLGLSNMIVGAATLDEVIVETAYRRLSLVPAGVIPPNPGELLSSHRMKSAIQELAAAADFVLIDTPPCRLYADPLLLSVLVDGLIYVLRAGSQDKAAQRRVHKQLEKTKARVLGVVFNGVEVQDGSDSYGYYYGGGRNGKHR